MWKALVNTLRLRQNGRHFADDIFKCILLNENVWITIKNWLKFVPKGLINSIQALVQIMAWRRSGDKPLSEPMMYSLLTDKCVTRPQWDYLQYIILWINSLINIFTGSLTDVWHRTVSISSVLNTYHLSWRNRFNPSRHIDTIWLEGSCSTLTLAMVCCLTEPSHHLYQLYSS